MTDATDTLMGLALDPEGEGPVYVRIRDHIAGLIQKGALAEGARLPPVRVLARALAVNPMTAARAYRQLAEAGLVEGRGGGGTVVLKPPVAAARPAEPARSGYKPGPAGSTSSNLFDLAHAPGVISFTANYPDIARSDVAAFRRCIADLAQSDDADRYFRYDPPAGREELCRALSPFLATEGIDTDPGSLVITSGGQQAIDLTIRLLVQPGDKVIAERPAYFGMLNVLRAARAEIVEIATGPEGPDPDELAALIRLHSPRAVCLNPTFQNPTGATIALERRRAILGLAREAGCAIVEDEHYPEMRFRGAPVPAFKALAEPDEPVFYCRGFGKMFLPGVRLGFAVVPAPALPGFTTLKAAMDLQSNAFMQGALAAWLDGGTWRARAAEAVAFYGERQTRIVERLRETLPPGTRFAVPDGGLNLWLDLPADVTAEDMYFGAAHRGIAFAAGDPFFAHEPDRRTLRLSFGRIEDAVLEEGLERLGRFVWDLRRPAVRPSAWFV